MPDISRPTFVFELGEQVLLSLSRERGEVIGRAHYTYAEPSYLIRYVTAQGVQVEAWQTENAVEIIP